MNWFEHATIWCLLLCVISTIVLLVMLALKLVWDVTAPAFTIGTSICCVATFILFVAGFLLQGRFGSKVGGA